MAIDDRKCACCSETTEEDLLLQLDELLQDYIGTPGALIPVLQMTQSMFGLSTRSGFAKNRRNARQALQRSCGSRRILLLFLDGSSRKTPGPRLPRNRLLCSRQQGGA